MFEHVHIKGIINVHYRSQRAVPHKIVLFDYRFHLHFVIATPNIKTMNNVNTIIGRNTTLATMPQLPQIGLSGYYAIRKPR